MPTLNPLGQRFGAPRGAPKSYRNVSVASPPISLLHHSAHAAHAAVVAVATSGKLFFLLLGD
jgi:hypothetical protein